MNLKKCEYCVYYLSSKSCDIRNHYFIIKYRYRSNKFLGLKKNSECPRFRFDVK